MLCGACTWLGKCIHCLCPHLHVVSCPPCHFSSSDGDKRIRMKKQKGVCVGVWVCGCGCVCVCVCVCMWCGVRRLLTINSFASVCQISMAVR